jgi:hypothetical protein
MKKPRVKQTIRSEESLVSHFEHLAVLESEGNGKGDEYINSRNELIRQLRIKNNLKIKLIPIIKRLCFIIFILLGASFFLSFFVYGPYNDLFVILGVCNIVSCFIFWLNI